MKKTVLFCVLFLISIIGSSQSLEGEWKGYFTEDNFGDIVITEIVFQFSKLNDTTFEGISTTIYKGSKKKKHDTSICILRGFFYEENVLLLEETRTLKNFRNSVGCLQLMKLYYRVKKEYIELEGDWYTEDKNCGSGRIRLTKFL